MLAPPPLILASADAFSSSPVVSTGGGNSFAASLAIPPSDRPSRYESQKRRDWITFGRYLRNHHPPLALSRCSGAHVLEFLRYVDQFGKTKVHAPACPFFGRPHPPSPCPCPLRQAWGSLDSLVGRLRAAFDENGAGKPEDNPFGARAVRLYLREVRDTQARARGIAYEKRKRRPQKAAPSAVDHVSGGGQHVMLMGGCTAGGGGGQFGNYGEDQGVGVGMALLEGGYVVPLSVFN